MSPFKLFHRTTVASSISSKEQDTSLEPTKTAETTVQQISSGDHISEDAQNGVRNVEAITLTWSKKALITTFANFWLIYLVNAFQSNVTGTLTPYITSSWSEHSLLTTITIVSSAMAAAAYVTVAKILDVFGRPEGFSLMMVIATVGLIVMASCNSLAAYCAANVLHTVGFAGMIFAVDITTADTSSLRHRGLAFATTSSPYIITAFAGPKVAELFYNQVSWRWGVGTWAIVLPVVASPLFFVLKYNQRKANVKRVQNWSIHDFDPIGVFLLASGLVIFLLPFSLADAAPNGWSSGYIIAMLVIGFVLLVAFGLHERFTAVKPFLPWNVLTNRCVLGACLLDFTYYISYYCWSSYFTSFLQVVCNLSISTAGYVDNTFTIVSGFLLFLVGYAMSTTGRFKWLLYIALPFYMLGQGLMIYFRHPNVAVGYLVMCQIFTSIGGAIIIIVVQVAVMAEADHQHVAGTLGMLSMVAYIGAAVGSTISGTVWTNTFPRALALYLPEGADFDSIYGSLDVQLSYANDTPERNAIQMAYGYAQKRMCIAGTAVMSLCFIWIFVFKNTKLDKQQTKGRLF